MKLAVILLLFVARDNQPTFEAGPSICKIVLVFRVPVNNKLGHVTTASALSRNVSCETEAIGEAVTSLRANGFLNYFGMQRFGTSAIPTYSVGK